MSEIVVYLIQNFASHLLAAIITLYILKCLLQYCNTGTGSSRPSTRSRLQLTGRRCTKRQDSLQRIRLNRNVKNRCSPNLDPNRSRSKLRKGNATAYVLSEDGYLQPCVERETNAFTTTTTAESLKYGSETDATAGESSSKPKRVKSSPHPADDNADSLKSNSEESNDNTKSPTSKKEKCAKPSEEDVRKAQNNVEKGPSRDDKKDPPLEANKPKKRPSQSSILSRKSSSQSVEAKPKPAKSSDELGPRRSDSEKGDKSSKKKDNQSGDENEEVEKKNKCTNTVILIDIKKSPKSMKRESEISSEPSNLTFCTETPQDISCESINCEELDNKSRTCSYQTDSSSDDLSDLCRQNSCMGMQKGDWAGTPHCICSPSYGMPNRCCEQQTRRQRYEPNSFKTVVIDFRPGYFFTCFANCCKKLFASDSNEECVTNKCPCSCSNCKYNNQICSKPESNTERQSEIDNKSQTGSRSGSQTGSKGGSRSSSQTGSKGGSKSGSQTDGKGGSKSGSQADSKGGSKSGSQIGSNGGSKSGSQTGSKGGSHTGSKSGSQTGSKGGSPTGNLTGSHTGSKSGSPTGSPTGSRTGIKSGSQIGSKSGSQTGSKGGSHTGSKGGSQTGSKGGSLTGNLTVSLTGSKSGSPTGSPTGSRTGIKSGSQIGSKSGSPTGSKSGSKGGNMGSSKSQNKGDSNSDNKGDSKSDKKGYTRSSKKSGSKSDSPKKSKSEEATKKDEEAKEKLLNVVLKKDEEDGENENGPQLSLPNFVDEPPDALDKPKSGSQKSQSKKGSEKTVGYCSIGVSTSELEKNGPSRSSRLETSSLGKVPSRRYKGIVETYDLLSSSSELSENSNYQLRKKQESKNSFIYLRKDPLTFGGYSSTLPLVSKPPNKQTCFRIEEPSLIGWRKDNSDVYDVSETSLVQNSSESSDKELPRENCLNLKKKKKVKSSNSNMESNDSEENEASKSRKGNPNVNPKICDNQATDSEGKSSIDEELAKDLVQSFRSILSEITHSTLTETEPIKSPGSRKKYKLKMNPRKRKLSIDNLQIYSDKYEEQALSSSDSSIKSSIKTDLKNDSLKSSFPPHQLIIDNVVINSSDYEENEMGETHLDIKHSIEKNLAELASLLPSFSQQSPPQQMNERQCTCKRSQHSIKKPFTIIKDPSTCYIYPSSDGCEFPKYCQEKRDTAKTRPKYAQNKTEKSSIHSKKFSVKTPHMKNAIKQRLVKQSKSSSFEDMSNHRVLTKNLEQNYCSGENNSKEIKKRLGLLTKCKTMKDLTSSSETKHSRSSPMIGFDEQNKRRKLLNKGKSIKVCFSNLDLTNDHDTDTDYKVAETCEKPMSVVVGEDYGIAILDSQADDSESNESTNSNPEKRKIFEIEVANDAAGISLGSLDNQDLSSYTILDLGLPSDTRFPTVSLFPSNMNQSLLVLQRHGSTDIPILHSNNAELLDAEMDGGPRMYVEKPFEEETQRSRRRYEEEDGTYSSSDSEEGSDAVHL